MNPPITGISSMATRQVLAELASAYERRAGARIVIESVGGVDAAKRVQAGEAFDVVILAADVVDKLAAAGRTVPGSKVDLVVSGVAIAVRARAPRPDISTEAALKNAVLSARNIGYSTGPSGVQLVKLFERWGIAEDIKDRTVQAPPGVPVGTLVARGEVELGFQQRSELMHLPGIDVIGTLPAAVRILTTFSGAVCSASAQPAAARALLDFMASPKADEAKRRHGMDTPGATR
jgi:molybdate transport system substrate-binding protein